MRAPKIKSAGSANTTALPVSVVSAISLQSIELPVRVEPDLLLTPLNTRSKLAALIHTANRIAALGKMP
jgi:hypothetical protein